MERVEPRFPGLLAAPAWGLLVVLAAMLLTRAAPCEDTRLPAPPPVRATHGMVVSAHEWASNAGVEAMKSGGNAVDAAVAAAMVLGVVEPYSAGIGGGGFMLLREGKSGEVHVIDYRETAPAGATKGMYLDAKGDVAPGRSTEGYLSVGVPGTIAGLAMAVEKYGRRTLAQDLEAAIRAADEGFPVHEAYARKAADMKEMLRRYPEAARIFLDAKGEVPAIGTHVRQPELAATLREVAAKGAPAFYGGRIAGAIAGDMAAHGGLVTLADLESYKPRERTPVRGTYRGYEIVSMPPPSSGGIHVMELLNIIENDNIGATGFGSASSIHLMAEAMRRAYADRAEFLGDPAFVKVPVNGLLSKKYAAGLFKSIDREKATPSASIKPGTPAAVESPSTTHLSVVDADGNAVSLTQTINYTFGSGVVVPGTGILLNNEMDDFTAKPGVPNLFGLVQGEANAVAPGKIPLSSMSPTMVLKDGKLFMVVGTPGGSRIITMVVELIVNVIDFRLDISQALYAPRFHHQWLPDELAFETSGMYPEAAETLRRTGHKLVEQKPWGNAQAIMVEPGTGTLLGASDVRGVGKAVGY